jgi:hypothetical protein
MAPSKHRKLAPPSAGQDFMAASAKHLIDLTAEVSSPVESRAKRRKSVSPYVRGGDTDKESDLEELSASAQPKSTQQRLKINFKPRKAKKTEIEKAKPTVKNRRVVIKDRQRKRQLQQFNSSKESEIEDAEEEQEAREERDSEEDEEEIVTDRRDGTRPTRYDIKIQYNAILHGKEMAGNRQVDVRLMDITLDELDKLRYKTIELFELSRTHSSQYAKFLFFKTVVSYPKCTKARQPKFDIHEEAECDQLRHTLVGIVTDGNRPFLAVTGVFELRDRVMPPRPPPQTPATQPAFPSSLPAMSQLQTPVAKIRMTSTARQIRDLPGRLEACDAAGNFEPRITHEWPCRNKFCPNEGKTCWNSDTVKRDNAVNHFPINTQLFKTWCHDIKHGTSTAQVPAMVVIVALIEAKRGGRKGGRRVTPPLPSVAAVVAPTIDSQATQLQMLLSLEIAKVLRSFQAPSSAGPRKTSPPLTASRSVIYNSSSLVYSQSSREDLMDEFFQWFIPLYASDLEEEVYDACVLLSKKGYNVQQLRHPEKGGVLTMARWEAVGGPEAVLFSVWEQVPVWKRQRKESEDSTNDGFNEG